MRKRKSVVGDTRNFWLEGGFDLYKSIGNISEKRGAWEERVGEK